MKSENEARLPVESYRSIYVKLDRSHAYIGMDFDPIAQPYFEYTRDDAF